MQSIQQLTGKFGDAAGVSFKMLADDYPAIEVRNQHATATVALHGAHLTHYRPAGGDDVIFTSKAAVFQEGKAIRGGIPVCWPWFGAQPDKSPSHGYARISFWTLEKIDISEQATRLVFALPPRAGEQLAAMLEIRIGRELQLDLHSRNLGTTTASFSEALHSYFSVSDSGQTQIHGLDGADYLDTVGGESRHTQNGPVRFPGEVDRIYDSNTDLLIEDAVTRRKIRVSKAGSSSTVVWNPGADTGAGIKDLLSEEIQRFVCAETANVRDRSITLAPGESHTTSLKISIVS